MARLKRLFALSWLAGLAAALALAAPAHATKVIASCVIGGEAKVWDKNDPMLGVRLVGGKGAFHYDTFVLACLGMAKGTPDAQVLRVTADGVFESVICGTGKVWGTITSLAAPAKYRNLLFGAKFAIHFTGVWAARADGLFFWHDSKATKLPFDPKDDVLDAITKPAQGGPKPKVSKDWHLAGSVKVDMPTQKQPPELPNDPPGNCTKGLTLSGTILIFAD